MYGPFTCEVHKNWDFLTTIPLTQPISTVVSTDEPTTLLPLSAEVICEQPLREMESEGEGGGGQVAQIAKWRGRMAQKRTGRKRGRREREERRERGAVTECEGHVTRRGKNFPEGGREECYDRNSNTSCAHSRLSPLVLHLSPFTGRQILLYRYRVTILVSYNLSLT